MPELKSSNRLAVVPEQPVIFLKLDNMRQMAEQMSKLLTLFIREIAALERELMDDRRNPEVESQRPGA